MKRLALWVLGVWIACLPVAAHADPSIHQDIAALMAEMKERYGFPGATLGYVDASGKSGTISIGLADLEAGTPMKTDTKMLAASIGKSVFAALVLALESEGVLSTDDLVLKYLGEDDWFARVPNSETITIKHLLNHTSGLPDHVHMDGVVRALLNTENTTPNDAIAFVLNEAPLFKAGEGWSYTDTGYLLLGLVIERATDSDVFDLAYDYVLKPLQLINTVPSNSTTIPGLAVGYTVEPNPFRLPARTADNAGTLLWNPAIEWTGGGFASTSLDLARWGHALFLGRAIEGPYLDRLLDSVPVHKEAPHILYGAGVAIYAESDFGPVYGHGGWIPGYVSSLRYYADHKVTIAFQINTDVGVANDSSDLVPVLERALADLLITP